MTVATDPRAVERTTNLLRRAPTSYRACVERVAAAWSSEEPLSPRRPIENQPRFM